MAQTSPKELRPRVPERMREQVHNIAKNYGVSIGSLLKPAIQKLIDETPDRYKRDPNI